MALGALRPPDAFGLLQQALNDPVGFFPKSTAIVGFDELRDPRAVSLVQNYLFIYEGATPPSPPSPRSARRPFRRSANC